MAHPLHHAESSARKWGGCADDYQAVHDCFDATKAHHALATHRALRHHTLGIFEAERHFGYAITMSTGRKIPVRWIGEQHVREDCRRISTPADWLHKLPIESWMVNGVILPDTEYDQPTLTDWQRSVAAQQTVLSFEDWKDMHCKVVTQ